MSEIDQNRWRLLEYFFSGAIALSAGVFLLCNCEGIWLERTYIAFLIALMALETTRYVVDWGLSA